MNKMKKAIGSSLLGLAVLGGATSVAIGTASADPGHQNPGTTQQQHQNQNQNHQQQRQQPQRQQQRQVSNGANPNWRPGPVQHNGKQYQPVWNAAKAHWGIWVGPLWISIG